VESTSELKRVRRWLVASMPVIGSSLIYVIIYMESEGMLVENKG
jgi:hypothetical protein